MNSRLDPILVMVVLLSALSIVSSNHRARKLVTEYERETSRMQSLDVEWGQLQLEQSTWASHARIEKIARQKLMLKTPSAGQVVALDGNVQQKETRAEVSAKRDAKP